MPNYTARCKNGCGYLVFAASIEETDSPQWRRKIGQRIAEVIADGYNVVQMTDEEIRADKFGCKCQNKKKVSTALVEMSAADTAGQPAKE